MSDQFVFIAVLGVAGAGKGTHGTFVYPLTQDPNIIIGQCLKAQRTTTTDYRFH